MERMPEKVIREDQRSKQKTFVLVHGAWHGGWCWQRVAARLARDGHLVYTPTLTGVGERSHLASTGVNLSTHVLDVVNEVEWKDLENFVLCAHSYGGMVATGAVERIWPRLASVVYLDAFLPRDGQSADDIVGAAMPAENGLVAPITAEQFNVNAADRTWVNRKMTPQSAACFSERLKLTGALDRIPGKTYIRAAGFPMPAFQATFERLSADPAWATHAMDCGHDIMIDAPEALAALLLDA